MGSDTRRTRIEARKRGKGVRNTTLGRIRNRKKEEEQPGARNHDETKALAITPSGKKKERLFGFPLAGRDKLRP